MTRRATEQHRVCHCGNFRPRNDETPTTGRDRCTSRAGVRAEAPVIRAAPAEPILDLTMTVSDLLTIDEMASVAHVATSALRIYDAEGLVIPAERTAAGYRLDDAGCGCRHLGSCGCLPLKLPPVDQSEGELDAVQTGACGCGMAAGQMGVVPRWRGPGAGRRPIRERRLFVACRHGQDRGEGRPLAVAPPDSEDNPEQRRPTDVGDPVRLDERVQVQVPAASCTVLHDQSPATLESS